MEHCWSSSSLAADGVITVMVVDDDRVALNVIASLLRMHGYRPVLFDNPAMAYATLMSDRDTFDIVITDVHMPGINGFTLLSLIHQELDVPVILMSADPNMNIAIEGLRNGARQYLQKPIDQALIRNLWQLTVRTNKKKMETNHLIITADNKDVVVVDPRLQKKAERIFWNHELKVKFEDAINKIGLENAFPKKILQVMNVPGLTEKNIASHLQVYRRKHQEKKTGSNGSSNGAKRRASKDRSTIATKACSPQFSETGNNETGGGQVLPWAGLAELFQPNDDITSKLKPVEANQAAEEEKPPVMYQKISEIEGVGLDDLDFDLTVGVLEGVDWPETEGIFLAEDFA